MDPIEFRGAMPTMTHAVMLPGDLALDEGTYACMACEVPGAEVSLLPGDPLPECVTCGMEARWVKI